jgi:hypothetical protein
MFKKSLWSVGIVLSLTGSLLASPFASEIVSFTQGPGAAVGYNKADTILGQPPVGDDWGTFNSTAAPYSSTDVLALGNGGSVTIKFDHAVINNSSDVEYGVDFIVLGNSFFGQDPWPTGPIYTLYGEPAVVEVSQDGINYYAIAGVYADDVYPYIGDASKFVHATPAGIGFLGRTPAQVEADYAGGCGGAQIDISKAVGANFDWIQYVRVTDIAGDAYLADVVGFADVVPEPASLMLFGLGSIFLRRSKKNA